MYLQLRKLLVVACFCELKKKEYLCYFIFLHTSVYVRKAYLKGNIIMTMMYNLIRLIEDVGQLFMVAIFFSTTNFSENVLNFISKKRIKFGLVRNINIEVKLSFLRF